MLYKNGHKGRDAKNYLKWGEMPKSKDEKREGENYFGKKIFCSIRKYKHYQHFSKFEKIMLH